MSGYHEGQKLPTWQFAVKSVSAITVHVAVLDYFPAMLERDYAQRNGYPDLFMNTAALLTLFDRYVLDWAGPTARIRKHGLVMRKPVHVGTTVDFDGTVSAVRPFAGSSLAGPGTEVELSLTISHEGEQRTTASVTIVVPDRCL